MEGYLLDREKYWDKNYAAYWKGKTQEANDPKEKSSALSKDTLTSSDKIYHEYIDHLNIQKDEDVLELAVGFGRSIPLLAGLAKKLVALDISEEMVELAKASYDNRENVEFHVSEAENTPLSESTFDVVVCFAAFDAMYQTDALLEINRVCRIGARVLLTGKNDNYLLDDELAIAAEIGAREKGHPNFFTDVVKLKQFLVSFGFSLEKEFYFVKRGDFGANSFVTDAPEAFYEWAFFLKKNSQPNINSDVQISSVFSKTLQKK